MTKNSKKKQATINMKKRILTILLSFCVVAVTLPMTVFAEETITIKFDMQGHGTTSVPEQTVSAGATIAVPSAPVAATGDKYNFVGWSAYPSGVGPSGFYEPWDFSQTVEQDTMLYAQWRAWGKLTLVLAVDGTAYSGAAVKAVRQGDDLTFDLVETSSGEYSCEMPEGTYVTYVDGVQQVTEYLSPFPGENKRYLRFYSLTLDGNGQTFASGKTSEVQLVPEGNLPSVPEGPVSTDDNYKFVGWTVSPEASSESFNFYANMNSAATAYAQWTKIATGEYPVSFIGNGAKNNGPSKATASGDYTTQFIPVSNYDYPCRNLQIKVGGTPLSSNYYTINYDTGVLTIDKSAITGPIEISVNMTPAYYCNTYMPNGGSGPKYYQQRYLYNTTYERSPTLDKTGFIAPADRPYLKGWCSDPDGSSTVVAENKFDYHPTREDKTFYAIWWKGVDSVNIDKCPDELRVGGTTGGALAASVSGVSGVSQDVKWSVRGAKSSQTTINENGDITIARDETAGNITVRAISMADTEKYAEKTIKINPVYAVTVNKGTGDGSYEVGNTVTITADAAPSGQEFDKWTVVSGGITLENATSASTSFTMPAEAVEVTATYKNVTPPAPTAKPVQMLNTYASAGSTQIKLNWSEVKGADGYYIYGNRCGKSLKKLKTVKGTTWTQKNLKKGGIYKYQMKAYQKTKNGTKILKTSMQVHVATLGSKKTNAKSIRTNFTNAVLKKGATKQINSTTIKKNSKEKLVNHVSKYRYSTNCSKIATVSKSGKIKAVGKGKCYVYVYANNGVCKKLTINVK